MPGKKLQNQKRHAKKRFWERYEIRLTDEIHAQLVRAIQRGRFKCVEKQSLRVSIFEGELDGKKMHFVYDRVRHQIVTVMYPGGKDDVPIEDDLVQRDEDPARRGLVERDAEEGHEVQETA